MRTFRRSYLKPVLLATLMMSWKYLFLTLSRVVDILETYCISSCNFWPPCRAGWCISKESCGDAEMWVSVLVPGAAEHPVPVLSGPPLPHHCVWCCSEREEVRAGCEGLKVQMNLLCMNDEICEWKLVRAEPLAETPPSPPLRGPRGWCWCLWSSTLNWLPCQQPISCSPVQDCFICQPLRAIDSQRNWGF